MPLPNRVTPLGALVAVSDRGLVHGNRGCLHDRNRRIRRQFAVKRWIACRLEFRGWRRSPLMQPGKYTELFFLDEATALAAGHRPCSTCRREDYVRFVEIWREHHAGPAGADDIDARLHEERLTPDRTRRLHDAALDDLPDGAFVLHDGEPWLVLGGELLRWTTAGYTTRLPRPTGRGTLLTPPSLGAVLATDWQPAVPLFHPTALPSGAGGAPPHTATTPSGNALSFSAPDAVTRKLSSTRRPPPSGQ